MADFNGQAFGRYVIGERINAEGLASVYKARDTHLDCEVAVRVLYAENLGQNELQPAIKLFEREARTIAQLANENIVRLLDYGDFQGSPYLVLEYLPGGSLKSLLVEKRQIPWQEAAIILKPIALGLASLHSEGVIHGELRPARILFSKSGTPKLAFFANTALSGEAATRGLAGMLASVGLPEYLAPEYVTSTSVDAHVDIYALGIILYEMITGHIPFEAATPLAVLFKHATETLPDPVQFVAGLPKAVEEIIRKAVEKKPEQRYASMQDFAVALSQITMAVNSASPDKDLALSEEVKPKVLPADEPRPVLLEAKATPQPFPTTKLSIPETLSIANAQAITPDAKPAPEKKTQPAWIETEVPAPPAPTPVALKPAPSIQKQETLPPVEHLPTPIELKEPPAPSELTCLKCGHIISEKHRFCTKCGEKIR